MTVLHATPDPGEASKVFHTSQPLFTASLTTGFGITSKPGRIAAPRADLVAMAAFLARPRIFGITVPLPLNHIVPVGTVLTLFGGERFNPTKNTPAAIILTTGHGNRTGNRFK